MEITEIYSHTFYKNFVKAQRGEREFRVFSKLCTATQNLRDIFFFLTSGIQPQDWPEILRFPTLAEPFTV